jgi:hypothetical protein
MFVNFLTVPQSRSTGNLLRRPSTTKQNRVLPAELASLTVPKTVEEGENTRLTGKLLTKKAHT